MLLTNSWYYIWKRSSSAQKCSSTMLDTSKKYFGVSVKIIFMSKVQSVFSMPKRSHSLAMVLMLTALSWIWKGPAGFILGLQSFLGFANFHFCLIKNYSKTILNLTSLTKNEMSFCPYRSRFYGI